MLRTLHLNFFSLKKTSDIERAWGTYDYYHVCNGGALPGRIGGVWGGRILSVFLSGMFLSQCVVLAQWLTTLHNGKEKGDTFWGRSGRV
ncbi:hypothetical protein M419DRAFT_123751 [Trichoderma reesei RUT C-30]|uniref:Uncharacterized protein n=1 Tax=Hypocrea jecorina (strain ATCC 56765 / BCRC 32924 / NRRL 11460 / Rut C-30) TaxID=1344414 RepID=A0A024S652_HYPJR|nr:hypothetical protein M419DRAFT_123751 [Trichoderma reesei RUT C-30]